MKYITVYVCDMALHVYFYLLFISHHLNLLLHQNLGMPLELGYWALRGLGEPSRLLLRYTETGLQFVSSIALI